MRTRFLLALSLTASTAAAQWRVGAAETAITPPAGLPMAGYYHVRLSEGVHDDLHAKALVFESGGVRAAVVALDLISLPRALAEEARRQIEARTAIPAARVLISATHSHTGPEMGSRLKGVDAETERKTREWSRALPSKIAEAVERAAAALQPARISTAAGYEDSISFVRRFHMKDGSVGWNPGKRNPNIVEPTGAIDPRVPILWVETDKGQPLAASVNFANHLDTTGGLHYSSDYPYQLSRTLRVVHGDSLLVQFQLGCAGNINHINVASAEPQKGYGEAARIGSILAAAVLKALPERRAIASGPIAVRSEIVPLPPAPYSPAEIPKAEQAVAAYGKPNARPFNELVQAFKAIELHQRDGKPYEAEVQVVALGREVAWVGLPGEIFVELGRSIQLRSPFRHTVVVSLANGSLGYVPDLRAYPQGAYEVNSSRLAAGGGEKMADAAVRMLLEMHAAGR